MGRNAPDAFGPEFGGRRTADIAKTKHAYDPFVLADDWQPPNLQLFHVPHRLQEIFVLMATTDFCSHRIARRSIASVEMLAARCAAAGLECLRLRFYWFANSLVDAF
jgi:hypothetical protein